MTDTIERMARAMCEADGFNWDDQLDPMKSANGDENGQAHYFAHARACLSALEEPSEAQLYAAHKAAKPYFDRGETVHAIRHALQAMIRTAKGGEG